LVSWHRHILPLEKAYESETGVEYVNLDSTRQFSQWSVVFVDDNSILIKMENLGYADSAGKILKVAKRCLEVCQ